MAPDIRIATDADRPGMGALLDAWRMRPVARLGELYDPTDDPAIVAVEADGAIVGVLTYRPDDRGWELGTFYVTTPRAGIGSSMLERFVEMARGAGARRVWVVTTNDNVDALRFYQRRGFRLLALHPGAVDEARRTRKASIPEVGDHGIPLRDEIVLEHRIDAEGTR